MKMDKNVNKLVFSVNKFNDALPNDFLKTWFMELQNICSRHQPLLTGCCHYCLLFQYFMKKIIYAVRTDMLFLKILMNLFGYMNWKVALRKETTALFVLEVCFYVVHNLLKYLALHTSFTMKYSQCKSSIKMLWTKLYNTIVP
jgi:hypothetical protein